ncbi:HhH-GPD-type base excision DNA repair protein [Streptomyces sp. NBC_00572]|uniref:HhH-GPD-type base excision DNA repair protein n=1 Tax=Streptomyces sp. NBC_00572 TaxID=2903664 RepID=UPI002250B464|nr:HhH-GPD-type base excision DNA repair protein [Streptomyces sp. NBC_00572]MCX4982246.1 Fe-S cluster assembly protein HesB [Streptomyces sp. NBC_00572]
MSPVSKSPAASSPPEIHLAQQAEADALLGRSPLAALVGMLLDQQVPMEWAFSGPYTIASRLGADDLDAHEIAARDPEEFAALLSEKPAVHRYPGSMAQRVQQLCAFLVEEYGGDAEAVWADAATGKELLARLQALPGFGKQKAQIFLALLGKQYGVRPTGWREAAGAYGEQGSYRSAADITGPESLAKVRAHKQEMKAAAKAEKAAKATKGQKPSGN